MERNISKLCLVPLGGVLTVGPLKRRPDARVTGGLGVPTRIGIARDVGGGGGPRVADRRKAARIAKPRAGTILGPIPTREAKGGSALNVGPGAIIVAAILGEKVPSIDAVGADGPLV